MAEWRQYSATAADTPRTDEATIVSATCDPAVPAGVSPPEDTALTPATSQVAKEPVPQASGRRSARAWLAAGMAIAPRIIEPARSALGNARVRLAVGMAVVVFVLSALGLYFIGDKPDLDPGTQDPDPGTPVEPITPQSSEIAGNTPPPDKPVQRPKPLPIPGTRFSDPMSSGGSGPIMVWLPAGEFRMGSPSEEAGRNLDERRHLARVVDPFAMGETELTLGHYRRFIEETGYRSETDSGLPCRKPDRDWQRLVEDKNLTWEHPGYEATDRHPVACVSWSDAGAYANWLSEQTGHRYRLPTELEWEYAARAGKASSRFWGDDPRAGCRYANTADCKDTPTYAAMAGIFPPNPFGLREMLGNLAEWTCSAYEKDYDGGEATCSGRSGEAPQVFRGGSWLDAPALVRSAARDGAPRSARFNTVGFRLVRTFDPASGSDTREEPESREADNRKVRR